MAPTTPEPPRVTIVDPKAPSLDVPDLLDHGRDGWRPSRYQTALAVLVAAIVAVISGGVAEIRHVHHEQSLDRAAVRGVGLYASIEASPYDPTLQTDQPDLVLSLANLGLGTVTMLAAHLDGTSVALPPGGVMLPRGAGFTRPLPPPSCGGGVVRTSTREVTVDLTTDRGQRVRHRILLQAAQVAEANRHDRAQCRTQLPEEALDVIARSVARRGALVTATLSVSNFSMLEVTLQALRDLPGLRVRARGLPLSLPPRNDPRVLPAVRTLVITLEATDCHAFARYFSSSGGEPALLVGLRGELEDGVGRIPMLLPAGDQASWDLVSELNGACPELFSEVPED